MFPKLQRSATVTMYQDGTGHHNWQHVSRLSSSTELADATVATSPKPNKLIVGRLKTNTAKNERNYLPAHPDTKSLYGTTNRFRMHARNITQNPTRANHNVKKWHTLMPLGGSPAVARWIPKIDGWFSMATLRTSKLIGAKALGALGATFAARAASCVLLFFTTASHLKDRWCQGDDATCCGSTKRAESNCECGKLGHVHCKLNHSNLGRCASLYEDRFGHDRDVPLV